MSAKLNEVERTTYQAFILGSGDQLVQPRNYTAEPTDEQLAEQLARFNYSKRDEFARTSLVVVKTASIIFLPLHRNPSQDDLAAARKRLDARYAEAEVSA